MGDFLLDKVGLLRSELNRANEDNRSLHQQLAWKSKEVATLTDRTRRLTAENEELRYELKLFGLPDHKDDSSRG